MPEHFSGTDRAEIGQGVAAARAAAASLRGRARPVEGWIYPKADLGEFGQDYAYRATVALGGLATLPRVEAMYMQPVAPTGGVVFDDDLARVLHFPAGRLPPAAAFWSMTMYEALPTGQFFLTANAISRYSIGSLTPGVRAASDGSLDICISRSDPGGTRSANWLPAPASGPYRMTLRAYLPGDALLDGDYRLPALATV